MWFDETGLPWVRPSPNLPTLASSLVYASLVAFEGSNLSVGRGTSDAFQRFGAPWLDAIRVASLLNDRNLRINSLAFDERFGSTRAREAIVNGADPRAVIDGQHGAVANFSRDARRFFIYP